MSTPTPLQAIMPPVFTVYRGSESRRIHAIDWAAHQLNGWTLSPSVLEPTQPPAQPQPDPETTETPPRRRRTEKPDATEAP